MRASTADRERAVDVLKAGFAEGRLNKDEYDMRVSQAYASRTYAELAQVTADLPGGQGMTAYPQPYLAVYRPPVVSRRTSSLAIASLVCGLAQPFFGLTTIPAIVLGYVARERIRRSGEDGSGLATAGLVLGWIGIGFIVMILLIVATVAAGHTGGSTPAVPQGPGG